MSYSSIVSLANSQSLMSRVAACASEQGNTDPRVWAANNLMCLASSTTFGWGAAWDAAVSDPSPNVNPDTGIRTDVISDAMILSAVQQTMAQQLGTQGWPAS